MILRILYLLVFLFAAAAVVAAINADPFDFIVFGGMACVIGDVIRETTHNINY